MKDSLMQLTMREWRGHMSHPTVMAALVAASVILGIGGPFGTFDAMPAALRLPYWTMIVVLTYGIGTAVTLLAEARITLQHLWLRSLLLAGLVAVAVTVVLLLVNGIIGQGPATLTELVTGFLSTFGICLAIEVAGSLAKASRMATEPPLAAIGPPPILQRLPFAVRGALLSISVQDHYVDVVTDAGRGIVLMRLGDAMAETAGRAGLQVHRSHWVALAAIRQVRRHGNGAILTLINGQSIPVSRGHLPKVIAAGLLPKRGRAT